MRVDKWVWAVRMVKSRTLAGDMCKQGKVLVNNEKVKPAKIIKLEDVITVNYKGISKVYRATGFIPKRVSSELAAKNYEDLSPGPETQSEAALATEQPAYREKGEGRPTKKDRRNIDDFMGKY